VALALQAAFFQHGGLTALGINALNMGVPALLAWQIFQRRLSFELPNREFVFGALAGGAAVLLAALMVFAELFGHRRRLSRDLNSHLGISCPRHPCGVCGERVCRRISGQSSS